MQKKSVIENKAIFVVPEPESDNAEKEGSIKDFY